MFGDRLSRGLRWAIVIAAAVLPYAGPRLAHAAPPAPGAVAINEVESSGGTPGDEVESSDPAARPMLTVVEILLARGTTSGYAGSADYEPSTATSPITVLGL